MVSHVDKTANLKFRQKRSIGAIDARREELELFEPHLLMEFAQKRGVQIQEDTEKMIDDIIEKEFEAE